MHLTAREMAAHKKSCLPVLAASLCLATARQFFNLEAFQLTAFGHSERGGEPAAGQAQVAASARLAQTWPRS